MGEGGDCIPVNFAETAKYEADFVFQSYYGNRMGELSVVLAITRNMPRIRGLNRLADLARRAYVRKRRPPVTVEVLGSMMQLDPHDYVDSWALFYPHIFDRAELHYVRRHLAPGDVFVDVGANIGIYTLYAARLRARVIAIEAAPRAFERLTHNIGLNPYRDCVAINQGVSDREEVLQLFLQEGNSGGNSFLRSHLSESVSVPCKPLYHLLREQSIQRIAGMKLDIEGFEYKVLQRFFMDAPPSLYPRFLIVEQWPEELLKSTGDAVGLLLEKGYKTVLQHEGNHVLAQ